MACTPTSELKFVFTAAMVPDSETTLLQYIQGNNVVSSGIYPDQIMKIVWLNNELLAPGVYTLNITAALRYQTLNLDFLSRLFRVTIRNRPPTFTPSLPSSLTLPVDDRILFTINDESPSTVIIYVKDADTNEDIAPSGLFNWFGGLFAIRCAEPCEYSGRTIRVRI